VPILTALEITADTVNNGVIGNATNDVKMSVKEGESVAAPLSQHAVFPPMVVQMLAVGEETGAMDEMLVKISDFYDDEVTAMTESLTAMLEPLMIGVLGGIVGPWSSRCTCRCSPSSTSSSSWLFSNCEGRPSGPPFDIFSKKRSSRPPPVPMD
jgi:hypothetical protein